MFKKVLLFSAIAFSSLFLSGCTLKKAPAALQVNTKPVANVFIDGKLVGKTPYQVNNLKPEEVTIKLIPESTTMPLTSWEGRVKLNAGVLTLIEREFASSEAGSSGQILTLEKTKNKNEASLSVVSDPDGALINIDGEAKGFTPIAIEKAGTGDHQIKVTKEGFIEGIVKAKTVAGFKLIVNIKLAQAEVQPTVTPTPAPLPSGKVSPTIKVTPSPKATISPSAKITPTGGEIAKPYVVIKDTPTGWLRVRADASTSAAEIAKVNPGEKYPLLEEKSGWIKISFGDNKEGWVSGQYVTLFK